MAQAGQSGGILALTRRVGPEVALWIFAPSDASDHSRMTATAPSALPQDDMVRAQAEWTETGHPSIAALALANLCLPLAGAPDLAVLERHGLRQGGCCVGARVGGASGRPPRSAVPPACAPKEVAGGCEAAAHFEVSGRAPTAPGRQASGQATVPGASVSGCCEPPLQ
eukprot:scaffold895_cov315-Pinguiococcus_pyrenoidosus.AAC.9